MSEDYESSQFDTIIFDLDDTLVDTEGQLIEFARQESLKAMESAGLQLSRQESLDYWHQYLEQPRAGDVFDFLVSKEKSSKLSDQVAQAGRDIFYRREIPTSFHAFAECPDVLSKLKTRYTLYLVTSGDPKTQAQKVSRAHLASFFNEIFYVNNLKYENKRAAFQQVLLRHDLAPNRILTVGNRIDHEIRQGKLLGFKTCWVQRGEHRFQKFLMAEDYPDFTITHIRELIAVCRL